jgi:hypothetical protein
VKCAAVLAFAACSRGAPIVSCDDDLRGVYVAGDERWMVLDNGATLEAYPLFPDGAAPAAERSLPIGGAPGIGVTASGARDASGPTELVVAPRVIDFERDRVGAGSQHGQVALAGTLRQRTMRHAERCDAHVPVHVTRCTGDTLELVLADPLPPTSFSPCTWPRPGPSRVVRWRRQ